MVHEDNVYFACDICGGPSAKASVLRSDNLIEIRGCTRQHDNDYLGAAVCEACLDRYPFALLKAAVDPFDYAMRLCTGEIIRFETLTIRGDYVFLSLKHIREFHPAPPYPLDRGLHISIRSIVWIADAPCGS